jgi:hypothetical protein
MAKLCEVATTAGGREWFVLVVEKAHFLFS